MAVSSVANSETFTVTTPSDCEIRMTRLFDAPRDLVFEAMSTPEHIKQWWGRLGEGYSVPVCEVDLRAQAVALTATAGSWLRLVAPRLPISSSIATLERMPPN